MSFLLNIQSVKSSFEQLPINFEGLLTNKQQLCRKLHLPDTISYPDLIRHCYLKWNENLVHHLKGEFSFSIWDNEQQKLIAGRDHIGIIPLYYLQSDKDFFVSPDPKMILNHPGVKDDLDPVWPIKYLLNIQDDYTKTIHPSLFRLPGGSILIYENGSFAVKRYWTPNHNTKVKLTKPDEYIDRFRELLNSAIANRIGTGDQIGCELSGGLDSSVVTAFTHQILNENQQNLTTFSDVFPKDMPTVMKVMINEEEDIKELIEYCNIKNNQFISNTNSSLLEILDLSHEVHIEPTFRLINIFSSAMYERAQKMRVTNLFSGFGGDETVSNPHAMDYKSMLSQGKYFYFLMMLFIKHDKLNIPIPDARSIYRMFTDLLGHRRGVQAKSKVKWKKSRTHLKQEMLDAYNMEEYYWNYKSFAFSSIYYEKLNQMLLGPRRLPFRLHYCHAMSQHFNVNYHYPLLDLDLVEFYYSIPDHLKGDNNMRRKIFRKAAYGYIPENIRYKTEKGGPSNPSHITLKYRDNMKVIERLKDINLNPNHKIHDYIDLGALINEQESILKKTPFTNSNVSRVYLMSRKLESY